MQDSMGATIWSRGTVDSDIFLSKPAEWFKIWFFLVTKANYKQTTKLKRGELYTSYFEIQKSANVSRFQVDRFMRWARGAHMVQTRRSTRGLYVFIVKYAEFQDSIKRKVDTPVDSQSIASRQPVDTITKERKQENILSAATAAESVSSPGVASGNGPTQGTPEIFDWAKYRDEEMLKDKNRGVRIIGQYFKIKDIKQPSRKAASQAIGRWLKEAEKLAEFTDDQIIEAFAMVDQDEFLKGKWTLGTVYKYIEKIE